MATLVRHALGRAALFLYRVCALFMLYAVLAGVLGYICVMGLYAVNTSWVAPVVISLSDDKSLSLTASLLATQSTIDTLTLDVQRQTDSVAEMKTHLATLLSLEPALAVAIVRENRHNAVALRELATLEAQKRSDNARALEGLDRIAELEASTNRELAAGLITKTEALAQLTSINQAHGVYTDSQIGEVLLKDNMFQKSPVDTRSLDILDRKAALRSQIAQLNTAIVLAGAQRDMESAQIQRLKSSLGAMVQTPYYVVRSEGTKTTFAFVPYDNKGGITIGVPVYDCYLKVVLCRAVGTVTQAFNSEEHGSHPIFRTDLRGFIIQLALDNQESAKSKTLFVNKKPLFL
jgi:hypothetical protein